MAAVRHVGTNKHHSPSPAPKDKGKIFSHILGNLQYTCIKSGGQN